MNYPTWLLDGIGPGWVIGLIACFHVLISQFAVGGGIFLPVTEYWARKNNRPDVLEFLKKLTKFFLILTNVLGAISGVGIWFSIGLISPDGTAFLIRLFAFFWAAEWVAFIVELMALVFYHYGWERMKPQTHQMVGWIYAIASWLSLFIINGILTFKLTPGAWDPTKPFETAWLAFFNPGFFPALIIRTLLCFILAGVYASFVITSYKKEDPLREKFLPYLATWGLPICAFLGICLFWFYGVTDPAVQGNLLSGFKGGVGNASFGNMTSIARMVTLSALAIFGAAFAFFIAAYLNPKEFGSGKSALLLMSLAVFVVCFEDSREILRKPYLVRNYIYSNGILKQDVPPELLKKNFTNTMKFKPKDSSIGQQMYVGQCMACHTIDGYRSLKKRLQGRDKESIYQLLLMMQKPGDENPYRNVMPPLVGEDKEVRALAEYLKKESKKNPYQNE